MKHGSQALRGAGGDILISEAMTGSRIRLTRSVATTDVDFMDDPYGKR